MGLILKRKDFARWQSAEKLPDSALCKAVEEMERGLIDADLGSMLYKKRIARPGSGKVADSVPCFLPGSMIGMYSCMGSRKATGPTSRRTKKRPSNTLAKYSWSCQHTPCPRHWNPEYY